MTNRRTVEMPIPAELLAAVYPPTTRHPEPQPELWGFAKDAVIAHELRGTLATTSELAAVDFGEKIGASPVLGIMDNTNQVQS